MVSSPQSVLDHQTGGIGFILVDIYLKINQNMAEGRDINPLALQLEGVASPVTDDDPDFKAEWEAIGKDRANRHTEAGYEGYRAGDEGWEDVDLSFRVREVRAITRSLWRNGILRRLPTPVTTWKPGVNA